MIKEYVHHIWFNHPTKFSFPKRDWDKSYPDRLEFKDIEKHLQILKDKYGADGGTIVTCTVEVEDDDYFDFDESIKKTQYKWDGNTITKIKEEHYD